MSLIGIPVSASNRPARSICSGSAPVSVSVRFFVRLYEAEVNEGTRYSSRTLA